ncbi:MAG: pyruvate dehydrogenase, partial [Bdellovibrionales bacterium]|nr:pyruvate dehydrogenase [Bdellovibrionales bacterium]
MIYQANHRADVEKGDPKVGGHPAASASALHILAALHLIVKTGFDHIANKPHASPADHALNYLLDLFLHEDLSKMSLEECNQAMMGLRAFSKNGEPVLQSYHSAYDPDRHNFFPSGTVGIPPVKAGYLAHAYHFAKDHGYTVPSAHFWSIVGDSEFREGSLFEAIPDFAEREIGNLTWIIDYNRQSLDGHRITNKEIMDGTDDSRIERTMLANGWHVIQVRHGKLREALFKKPGGKLFKDFLENVLEDYELQSLLLVEDMKTLKKGIVAHHPDLKEFMTNITDEELYLGLRDLGGHDIFSLAEAMIESKKDLKRPTVIIAHTIKGWGLHMAAAAGNHSSLASKTEIDELREQQGLDEKTLFARFKENTKEAKFLKQRGEDLYRDILEQDRIRKANQEMIASELEKFGSLPSEMGINLKLASYPHTQWMLGQITAKLSRIANTSLDEAKLKKGQKPLEDDEKPWKLPGELMVHMAPDVGTSTNLNPTMDGRIFGAPVVQDFESDFGVKNKKHPDLVPHEENDDRYLRFEIAEGNVMSCLGSFGKMRDITGIPFIPLMTVYDFFVKRALDQYFYDLYWKSSFILVGTPSGVTLSPEGAQHGWKSDFQ